jgi:hypothetical protein
MNIPIYIINHILSFRPIHPVANLIKNPSPLTCLEISDFWKVKSGFLYNISIDLMWIDNFSDFNKKLKKLYEMNNEINSSNKIYSNIIDIDKIIKNFNVSFYNLYNFIDNIKNYSEDMHIFWEEKYNSFPDYIKNEAFLEKYQNAIY